MSAAYDRALDLTRYRTVDVPPDCIERIFSECADPELLGGLLYAALDLFATIAPTLCSPEGLSLLWLKIAETEAYAQNVDQRRAAELILAYRWFTDSDNLFRDHGAAAFEHVLAQVHDAGRTRETMMAVCDVWLELLPWLNSREGMRRLERHAGELDSE